MNALRDLLPTTPWDRISVQMLCDHADIGRSSFYAHFEHKHDLLDTSLAALKDALREEVPARDRPRGTLGFVPALVRHMRVDVPAQKRTGQRTRAERLLYAAFERMVEDLVAEELGDEWEDDCRATFLAGGILSVCRHWQAGGCRWSNDELVARIDTLTIGHMPQHPC